MSVNGKKSPLLAGLNTEQSEAVTCTDGPVLVIAGAGTGKTTVIARRIAYLIGQKLAKPSEILALTFTDKAANEMEERVDQLLPFGAFDTTIATFHSFGERLLRECALDIGLPSDFRVLSNPQQVLFFQQNLFRFELNHYRPLSTPTKFIQALIALISRAKDECITPQEYQTYTDNLAKQAKKDETIDPIEVAKQQELARVYMQYENFKNEAGVLDFGDLIIKSLKLLQDQPHLLKSYQNKYRYILVDEFQDTNFAQNELVKLLAKKHKNICVVGDDDQSIYRFRGAAISNILEFKETYANAKQVVLTTNYRSTQPVLDGAYRLIQHNNPDRLEAKHNIVKKLEAVKGNAGFPIQTIAAGAVNDEVEAIASAIERLTSTIQNSKMDKVPNTLRPNNLTTHQPTFDQPLNYNDIAILVRANSQAEPILQTLQAHGIPYKFTGTTGLYERPEIRTIISFLTVITNFYDNLQLYNLCIAPFYDFPMENLIKLMDLASRKSKPLYWVIDHLSELGSTLEIAENDTAAIRTLKDDITTYGELAKTQNVGQVLYQFLADKGILTKLQNEDSAEAATQAANISKFFDKIAEFTKLTNDPSAKAFVEYLQILREAGDDPGTATIDVEYDGVNVMTVHAAKGLEFKTVFIANAVADRFPSRDRSEPIPLPTALIKETLPEGDFHLEEERRLFYVAVTRAADLLYITWARDYGGKRLRKVSPFAIETLGEANIPQTMLAPSTSKKLEQLDLFWGSKPSNPTPIKDTQMTFALEDERLLSLNQGQIEDYLTCPLKYKYSAILRIPLTRHHLFVYGAAIHKAIEHFYQAKMQGKTLPLAAMLEIYEHNWTDEGFLSEEHEMQRFDQGKLVLKKFFEREAKNPQVPAAIEKPFKIMFDGHIRLIGRMDRIDNLGDSVHIIDFKTTENMDEEKALRRAKDSKQLACYALIYYKLTGKLPKKLSLYFVEDGIFGSFEPTLKTMQQAEEFINLAAKGIRENSFDANPEYMACTYCPYSPICPYTAAKL